MLVVEIFKSIQGEGDTVGLPSVFVRLGKCNLFCSYCDTPQRYNYIEMSVEQVVKEVLKYDLRNVVVTGGEPLLQVEEVCHLWNILKGYNRKMEIETNGTLTIKNEDKIYDFKGVKFNISPKFSNVLGRVIPFREREQLIDLMQRTRNILKLVLSKDIFNEMVVFIRDSKKFYRGVYYLQPEYNTLSFVDMVSMFEKEVDILDRVRFIPQVHKLVGVR